MFHAGFWIAIAIVGVEVGALFFAPTWLARFALVPLAARRRVALPREAGSPDPAARTSPNLPRLPLGRVELDDAVLVEDGRRRVAVRRRYDPERHRAYYLVRIFLEPRDHELVLRARLALVPITLPLAMVAFALGSAQTDRWVDAGIVGGLSALVMFVVLPLSIANHRNAAIQQAFDLIEGELRCALDSPTSASETRSNR